jgi:predicted Zn-dependent protease
MTHHRHTSRLRYALTIAGLTATLLISPAWGYEHHDLTKIVRNVETPQGTQHELDLGTINAVIADLSRHAINYPPTFASAQERQLATEDARRLSGLLDIVMASGRNGPPLLRSVARLNAMAHNLDVAGAAGRADAAFKALLAQLPEDADGNYGYGLFLASTARPQLAIAYLDKAMRKGVDAAPYTLALAYLGLNDKPKALVLLEPYAKGHPDDSAAQKLAQAIRDGRVETRRRDAPK